MRSGIPLGDAKLVPLGGRLAMLPHRAANAERVPRLALKDDAVAKQVEDSASTFRYTASHKQTASPFRVSFRAAFSAPSVVNKKCNLMSNEGMRFSGYLKLRLINLPTQLIRNSFTASRNGRPRLFATPSA